MEAMIDLNVTALTRLTYAAAPAFVGRGGGTIINVSSAVAIAPEMLNGVYGATKAFVLALSLSLHQELADKNVRIQAVLPGATATNFWDAAGGSLEQLPSADRHAVGRSGRRCACRPRSGRARHHSFAARRRGLGRLRGGAAEAHAEPFAELACRPAIGLLWRRSGNRTQVQPKTRLNRGSPHGYEQDHRTHRPQSPPASGDGHVASLRRVPQTCSRHDWLAAAAGDAIRPFRVNIPEEQLADLRRRIAATRWPDRETVNDRSQGVQLGTFRRSCGTGARTTTGARPRPGSTPCPSS